ncbi:MAG: hypothetical protein ACRD04_08980 [Terriglobales bacterium]
MSWFVRQAGGRHDVGILRAIGAAATAAANVGPAAATMPAGPGKAETVQVCGGCLTLARVLRRHQTKVQWGVTIAQM